MRDHGHARWWRPRSRRRTPGSKQVNRVATGTMYTAPTCNSWYLGDNIPGKARVFLPWVAGLPSYIDHCDRIVAAGYEGFAFSMKGRRVTDRLPAYDFDLFGAVTHADSDASWVEPREQLPGGVERAARWLLGDQRLRRGRRRVPRLGALLVGAHRTRGQLDRARPEPPAAADARGDRPARLVPGAPGAVGAAGAPGRRAVASTRPALDDALHRPVHRSGGVRVHPRADGAGSRRGHARVARVPRRRLAHDHRRVPQRGRVLGAAPPSTVPPRPSSAT